MVRQTPDVESYVFAENAPLYLHAVGSWLTGEDIANEVVAAEKSRDKIRRFMSILPAPSHQQWRCPRFRAEKHAFCALRGQRLRMEWLQCARMRRLLPILLVLLPTLATAQPWTPTGAKGCIGGSRCPHRRPTLQLHK